MTEIQLVFQTLGFLSHPTDFSHAVPYKELRDALEGKFPETNVSKVLRHFPDYFMVNEKLEKGVFFVKDVTQAPLSTEAAKTYKSYYPKDILLIKVISDPKGKTITCRWINDEKDASLTKALESRFNLKLPAAAVNELNSKGWVF